jgi:hypothetical protein
MRFTPPGLFLAVVVSSLLIFCHPGVGLGQEISFSFEVSLDGVTSTTHMFGLHTDAQPGLDDHDIPSPPAAPDSPFHSYLVMSDPPATLPNQWLHDLRPIADLANDRIEIWQMELATLAVGDTCTITIVENQPGLAPYELNFFGPGAHFEDLVVPGSFSFPVTASNLVFFWELRLADEVDVLERSWGGVKSLYR